MVQAERCGAFGAQQAGADHRPGEDRDGEDQRDEEAVAHVACHCVHRHAGMAAVAVSVGLIGTLDGRVVVGDRRRAALGQGIADMARHRLSRAVIAALLHPGARLVDRVCSGSNATVAVWARGLAATETTPGR